MPLIKNFRILHWDDMFPKTLTDMRISANEAYYHYELTHFNQVVNSVSILLSENFWWGLTDTRYYHFNEEIPPSRDEQIGSLIDAIMYEQLSAHDKELKDMEIKPARLMPHDFEFLSKIEREFPGADVDANVLFRFKYGVPNKLFFIDPTTGSDWERRIQHAVEEWRRFESPIPLFAGSPLVLIRPRRFEQIEQMMQDGMEASTAFIQALFGEKGNPGEAQGAVSEGHIADKNHADFELTGKSVSADEIDDLLDRISEDIEKNTIQTPPED